MKEATWWESLAFVEGVVAAVVAVAALTVAAEAALTVAAVMAVVALAGVVGVAALATVAAVEEVNPKIICEIMCGIFSAIIILSVYAISLAITYIDQQTISVVCYHTSTFSQIIINGSQTATRTHIQIANTTTTELQSAVHSCP